MTTPTNSAPDCLNAWESMPWVLRNSATRKQIDSLHEHLAHCAACRTEFAQQSRLLDALSLPPDIKIDADAGLKRLLGRIDVGETAGAASPSVLSNWITRILVAAVLVQAIGISILGAKLRDTGHAAPYRTLSQEPPRVVAGTIRLVPDSSLTLAEWNSLLHAQHLKVVDGPNDVGAYAVVPTNAAPELPQILSQLRATRGIRLAEPIAKPP